MPVYRDKKRGSYYFSFKRVKNGKVISRTGRGFSSKTEATIAELKALDELNKPSNNRNSTQTLNQLFELFIQYQQTKVKITTLASYNKIYRCHIEPYIGSFLLLSLTNEDLYQWKQKIVNKGFSDLHTNSVISLMRTLIDLGLKKDLIKNNSLLDELEHIKSNKLLTERQVLTLEQINKFLDSFEKSDSKEYSYYLYFLALSNSGMRPNEFRCLLKKDIVNDYLVVNKSMTSKLGGDIIQPPKTAASNRKVLMPHYIIELLNEYTKDYAPDEYIFGKTKPFRETNIQRHLDKHIKACNLPHIVVYSFRHSHATNLIKAGVPIKVVSKRLGHSNASTTMNVYWHLFTDDEKQVLDILDTK